MISPASKRRSVLLIGCGNMGSAIALALQHTAENLDLTVIDPDEARARQILGSQNEIKVVNDSAALGSAQFEACILAVKPTSALETLVNTQQNLQSSLVISIAAGVPLAKLQQGGDRQSAGGAGHAKSCRSGEEIDHCWLCQGWHRNGGPIACRGPLWRYRPFPLVEIGGRNRFSNRGHRQWAGLRLFICAASAAGCRTGRVFERNCRFVRAPDHRWRGRARR